MDADRQRYRITGIDKETREERRFFTEAISAENAKVLAEMSGLHVTEAVEVNAFGQPVTAARGETVVVEQTEKRWKREMLNGAMGIGGGAALVFFGAVVGGGVGAGLVVFGLLLIVGGLGAYMHGRWGQWWHHG